MCALFMQTHFDRGVVVSEPTRTSIPFKPFASGLIDNMEISKEFCIHLEFKEFPPDHACGYHVIADILNEGGWPLDEMFSEAYMAKLNSFARMRRLLSLVNMQSRDGRPKRYQYLDMVLLLII